MAGFGRLGGAPDVVALRVTTDIGQNAQNDEVDP
jgi:hypothetical protein